MPQEAIMLQHWYEWWYDEVTWVEERKVYKSRQSYMWDYQDTIWFEQKETEQLDVVCIVW